MVQQDFARTVVDVLKGDSNTIGLAVAGSWLTNEMDEFSDLDLILVTKEKVAGDLTTMLHYAKRFGQFLSGFTGEHVGEPRVLICLYDNPLLHVDIKFLTLDEFRYRVETPFILLDNDGQLKAILEQTEPKFPYPDYQWIEDRFWIWIHYILLKIGRGEFIEAFDCFGFLRMIVFGPLLHIKSGNLPRGVRKVEMQLPRADLDLLITTLPKYSKASLLESLQNAVSLYRKLRDALYSPAIARRIDTEDRVMQYFDKIKLH